MCQCAFLSCFISHLTLSYFISARFYLATDERSQEGLSVLKDGGAVFISDLLDPVDRRMFGPELLITDVLAEVEQVVLSHAGFFYGSVLSSVSGGVINQRGLLGKDPRTSKAD